MDGSGDALQRILVALAAIAALFAFAQLSLPRAIRRTVAGRLRRAEAASRLLPEGPIPPSSTEAARLIRRFRALARALAELIRSLGRPAPAGARAAAPASRRMTAQARPTVSVAPERRDTS